MTMKVVNGSDSFKLIKKQAIVRTAETHCGHVHFTPVEPAVWMKDLITNMSMEKIGESQLRQKRNYDLRRHERFFNPGDLVYLRDTSTIIGVGKTLRPPWSGPYIVIVSRPHVKTLEGRTKSFVVHHDRLKVCRDSDVHLWSHRLLYTEKPPPDIPEEYQDDVEPFPDIDDDINLDATLPYMIPDDNDQNITPETSSSSDSESDSELPPAESSQLKN